MPIVGGPAACDPPASDPGPMQAKWRGAGLQSLGRCDACHAVDSVPGIGQLALTPSAVPRERDRSAPVDDAARVQAGGEVYSRACARCHGATAGPSAAAVVGLSDEQIAALATFLQRHAEAMPGRRERPRAAML